MKGFVFELIRALVFVFSFAATLLLMMMMFGR